MLINALPEIRFKKCQIPISMVIVNFLTSFIEDDSMAAAEALGATNLVPPPPIAVFSLHSRQFRTAHVQTRRRHCLRILIKHKNYPV